MQQFQVLWIMKRHILDHAMSHYVICGTEAEYAINIDVCKMYSCVTSSTIMCSKTLSVGAITVMALVSMRPLAIRSRAS